MFKKLKRNMLLTNMIILITFMLLIFVSLFMSTYTETNRRIDDELTQEIQRAFIPQDPNAHDFGPRVTFSIIEENGVVEYISPFASETTFMEEIYELTDLDDDTLTLRDNTYRYLVDEQDGRTVIVYTNITKDVELLQAQAFSYSLIFVVSAILVFAISYLLTEQNIKPIEESYEQQKEFIQNASHELKTPLTVINTNIDVLRSNNFYKGNKWLEYIKTEVERMNKLTGDLLYLAKNEEIEKPKQSRLNASDKLSQVLLGFEALAFEKGIQIHEEIEDNLEVNYNHDHFIQTVSILIDNAIKYTPKNSEIRIKLEKVNKNVILKVKNTGVGLTDEEQKRIFERFYKTDKSRKNTQSKSFGLGLSILQVLVQNNDASIEVDSVLEEYTQFTVKFK